MNLNELIPLLSAIAAAIGTAWVGHLNSSSNKESTYADHHEKLLEQIDRLLKERVELNNQIIELNKRVYRQDQEIDELKKEMKEIREKEAKKWN